MARDPGAYQFQRALIRRTHGMKELPRIRARGGGMDQALSMVMAEALHGEAQRAAVAGTFSFPLILGLYSDSPLFSSTYSRDSVQAEVFDGPQANPSAMGTVPVFYDEISGGRVDLTGVTYDWVETTMTQAEVTAGVSGLGGNSKVGEFIVRIIQGLDDGTVDWGQFDNDGPDGVPNSGDDDGYVDVLAIMHPDPGGECNTSGRDDRIWSHRWNLYSSAFWESGPWTNVVFENDGYPTATTATPSQANPDFPNIRILDYTIQPVTTCSGTLPNTIGVFAHELGHGFGLPDLYGVSSNQNGIGNWGLMGTGSWGCNGASSERPCHMSAWSKEFLGWADVEVLTPGADLGIVTLPPVETTGKVFRIDAGDGSGEYFLLENRQPTLFDENLYAPGLLVWHIDPEYIAQRRPSNTINSDGEHHGVWLRQADGRNDLNNDYSGRGDASDPFPGSFQRTELHAATVPGSWSHDEGAMGITLLDIQQVGSDITFRAVTGYQALTMETMGAPSGNGLISVDGITSQDPSWILNSAPFQTHTITAAPGEGTGTGYRVGFEGWADGSPRVREFQTQFSTQTFSAGYGGTEVHIDIALTSPVQGIAPGSIDFPPGDDVGWVGEGETVVVMAEPQTGFDFSTWTGALEGQPNPTTVVADAPMTAGATFDLTFTTSSNPPTQEIEAATNYFLGLEVENANIPVTWTHTSGEMPEGMRLDLLGRISGAAMERGTFPLGFHVVDAIGLEAELSLDLVVDDPVISIERLASQFLLTGPVLDFNQKNYLDKDGNVNGSYDLGDFRIFYLRNPDLPSSGDVQGIIELLVPMGDMKSGGSVKEVVR
jgi:M6 family metalloprotease-like protein